MPDKFFKSTTFFRDEIFDIFEFVQYTCTIVTGKANLFE